MPVYEYNENGRTVCRRLPVEDRDLYPGRVQVPDRLRVLVRSGLTEGQSANQDVVRGFYREEQSGHGRINDVVKAALGMSADQVKDAWAAPDVEPAERPAEELP